MPEASESGGRFVIQKHQARTLHYDFRLEREGVFKSWVVPKGVPEEIGARRLALVTEDHSLEFGGFEGEIPEGEYGAGTVEIWDTGTYTANSWTESEIDIQLAGDRISGHYQLVRFERSGLRSWLLFKRTGDSEG